MAKGFNLVVLIGNLGADVESRTVGKGEKETAVANFRIAISDDYKNSEGEWVEKTEWVGIVAWGKLAELCEMYLYKGSKVQVTGSMQTRTYENKDGNTVYVTEVKARDVMFLTPKSDSQAPGEVEPLRKLAEAADADLLF